MWGLFPLYWKQLSFIKPTTLLAHRICWSMLFLLLILFISKNKNILSILKNKKTLLLLVLTGVLIGTNWGTYIFAINTNQIVEASFGYYINPLINVLFGVLFLKEKLNKIELTAIGFALLGVAIMSYQIGGIPILSLVLAITFSLYGLLRKIINVDSISALSIETLALFPIAFWWIIHTSVIGNEASNYSTTNILLLSMSGVLTALPLVWFGRAATLIPLSTIGFMQYLSPTLQLLIGIIVYKESFDLNHVISFGIVWIGLGIYSWSMIKKMREKKNESIKN